MRFLHFVLISLVTGCTPPLATSSILIRLPLFSMFCYNSCMYKLPTNEFRTVCDISAAVGDTKLARWTRLGDCHGITSVASSSRWSSGYTSTGSNVLLSLWFWMIAGIGDVLFRVLHVVNVVLVSCGPMEWSGGCYVACWFWAVRWPGLLIPPLILLILLYSLLSFWLFWSLKPLVKLTMLEVAYFYWLGPCLCPHMALVLLEWGLVELSVGLVEPLVRVPPTVIREFLWRGCFVAFIAGGLGGPPILPCVAWACLSMLVLRTPATVAIRVHSSFMVFGIPTEHGWLS